MVSAMELLRDFPGDGLEPLRKFRWDDDVGGIKNSAGIVVTTLALFSAFHSAFCHLQLFTKFPSFPPALFTSFSSPSLLLFPPLLCPSTLSIPFLPSFPPLPLFSPLLFSSPPPSSPPFLPPPSSPPSSPLPLYLLNLFSPLLLSTAPLLPSPFFFPSSLLSSLLPPLLPPPSSLLLSPPSLLSPSCSREWHTNVNSKPALTMKETSQQKKLVSSHCVIHRDLATYMTTTYSSPLTWNIEQQSDN